MFMRLVPSGRRPPSWQCGWCGSVCRVLLGSVRGRCFGVIKIPPGRSWAEPSQRGPSPETSGVCRRLECELQSSGSVPFSLLVVSSFVFFQLVLAPQKPMRLAAGVNIDPNDIGTSIDPARLCRSRAGKVDGRVFVVGFQETMDFATSIAKVSHNKPFGIYVPSLCHIATGYVERHEAVVID